MALSAWLDMPQRAFRGGTRSGASNENWKCRWERPRDPDDMVGAAGIEPATLGLEIRCSIRLSYAPLDQVTATSTRGSSQSVVWGTTGEVPAQPQYRTASARRRVQARWQLGLLEG